MKLIDKLYIFYDGDCDRFFLYNNSNMYIRLMTQYQLTA